MPGAVPKDVQNRKRKSEYEEISDVQETRSRKAPKRSSDGSDIQSQILFLEEQVLGSREHYNNIVEIQRLANNAEKKPRTAVLAAVSLCRVFSRLIASEKLIKQKGESEADDQVAQWLKQRLKDYAESCLGWIGSADPTRESAALTLLMRIVKEETSQDAKRAEQAWRTERSTFCLILKALLENSAAEGARQEFAEKFVEEYDDVRFYTLLVLKQLLSTQKRMSENIIHNALDLLKRVEGIPDSEEQLQDWYGRTPEPTSHQLFSLSSHRKVAQECWLSILRSQLTATHRKTTLNVMTPQILPWFSNRVEILTDFLTDSFNEGGSISLLALSGIFHLMTKRNIDYPDFYTKLYSLLNEELMHSKHRSRFYRLLNQFMSSTHLPAVMVASFIKRLSRLSLQAPPGAIVWIVPWIYNMFQKHRTCTFMLHRPYHPAHLIYSSNPEYKDEGMDDPFDPLQIDPMLTNAIESSMWELHTLQDHWHPNVATLAKILGEQFTKRDYQLDDFLDHNYASLIDAELGKDMKKLPEVEWEIPKRIVTDEEGDGLNGLGTLLWSAVEAS